MDDEPEPEIVEVEEPLVCPECGSYSLTGRGTIIDGNWVTRWECSNGHKFTVQEFDPEAGTLAEKRRNRRYWYRPGRRRRR